MKFATLVGHLERLSIDSSFTDAGREEAVFLRTILTDQNFMALLILQVKQVLKV